MPFEKQTHKIPLFLRQILKKALFDWANRGFRPYIKEFIIGGEKVPFFLANRIAENWYQDSWWRNTDVQFLQENVVQPGKTVIDCGAHHGAMTILFSKWVGRSGKVIAIEPNPTNFEVLKKNILLNKLENVELKNVAIGAQEGSLLITKETDSQIAGNFGVGIRVPVISLDSFADRKPYLVKIDTEGYEGDVIKGCSRLLQQQSNLAIEIHPKALPRYGYNIPSIVSLVGGYDYHLFILLPGASSVIPYTGEQPDVRFHLFCVTETLKSRNFL